MPKYPKENITTPVNLSQLKDQQTRNNAYSAVQQFNTTIDNPQAGIQRLNNNTYILSAGEHGGIIIDKELTVYQGVPGTIINPSIDTFYENVGIPEGPNLISLHVKEGATARISGITFKGQVMVGSGIAANPPSCIFVNCTFEKEIVSSGNMHLIGCIFTTSDTAVSCFSGAINNYVIGCARLNGGIYNPFVPPTVIAETT